jgi:hypothetical protein
MKTSPTQRSLKLLREAGFCVDICERRIPVINIRKDLFGFIDILAMSPHTGFLAVQVTSGSNASSRVTKILNTSSAGIWLASGGKIVVHAWRQVGERGKRKTWQCRSISVTAEGGQMIAGDA